MRTAELALAGGDSLAQQSFGFVRFLHAMQEPGEAGHGAGTARIVAPEPFLLQRKCVPQERLGLAATRHGLEQIGEVVHGTRQFETRGAVGSLSERYGVAEEFFGRSKHAAPVQEFADPVAEDRKARRFHVQGTCVHPDCGTVRKKLVAARPALWLVVGIVRKQLGGDRRGLREDRLRPSLRGKPGARGGLHQAVQRKGRLLARKRVAAYERYTDKRS